VGGLQAAKTRDREFSGFNALIQTNTESKKHGFNLFRLDTPKGAPGLAFETWDPPSRANRVILLKYQTPPEFRI
jgi:hypothetical protein